MVLVPFCTQIGGFVFASMRSFYSTDTGSATLQKTALIRSTPSSHDAARHEHGQLDRSSGTKRKRSPEFKEPFVEGDTPSEEKLCSSTSKQSCQEFQDEVGVSRPAQNPFPPPDCHLSASTFGAWSQKSPIMKTDSSSANVFFLPPKVLVLNSCTAKHSHRAQNLEQSFQPQGRNGFENERNKSLLRTDDEECIIKPKSFPNGIRRRTQAIGAAFGFDEDGDCVVAETAYQAKDVEKRSGESSRLSKACFRVRTRGKLN